MATEEKPKVEDAAAATTNKDEAELEELTQKLYDGFDIADRKFRLTTYPKCFIARDAITWMVSNGIATNREDAVETGQLLVAADIIKHVTNDSEFKDDNLYFRFLRDEPHHGGKEKKPGTNQDWSWSDMTDMIPGQFKSFVQSAKNAIGGDKSNEANNNLQPHMDSPKVSDDEKDGKESDNDSGNDNTAKANEDGKKDEAKSSGDDDDKSHGGTFGISPLDKHNQLLLDNVHPVKWIEPEITKDSPKYNMLAIGAGAAGLVTAAGMT